MNKKAQAWGFDLEIAVVVFIAGIITFYFFAFNYNSSDASDNVENEAVLIADTLLSEGVPSDWTESTVIKPGLITNNRLDHSKLEKLYNLSNSDYAHVKSLMRTNFNFFINLSVPLVVNGQQVSGIGSEPSSASVAFKINRFVPYNNQPVTVNIIVWK